MKPSDMLQDDLSSQKKQAKSRVCKTQVCDFHTTYSSALKIRDFNFVIIAFILEIQNLIIPDNLPTIIIIYSKSVYFVQIYSKGFLSIL